MAYKPTVWVDSETPVNAENLNKLESGVAAAVVSVNGISPDENGNVVVEGGGGGNVDLTGYATEEWVREGYQPKGEYLTEHQDLSAYALKTELPSVPVQSVNGKTGAVNLSASDVGAMPNGTKIPSKTSDLTNDSGFITGYTETDPTVPSWAKASSKPSYSKSEVGLGNVDNVKQYSASNPPPYPVTSVNGKTGAVTVSVPTKVSQLQNDAGFLTEISKEEIVQQVITALGTPVFGRVDADNNIILTGELVEGNSYTVKYEDAEGNVMDVGSIVFEAPPAYTNLLESAGYVKDKRLSSTDGTTLKDAAGFYLTGYIPVPLNGVVRFQGINVGGSSYGNTVYIYDSSKKFLGAPTSTGLNETGRDCEAVYDSSNYLKQFTAKSTIMKSTPAFAGGYMRFGAVSISDGAIITVNEEIV